MQGELIVHSLSPKEKDAPTYRGDSFRTLYLPDLVSGLTYLRVLSLTPRKLGVSGPPGLCTKNLGFNLAPWVLGGSGGKRRGFRMDLSRSLVIGQRSTCWDGLGVYVCPVSDISPNHVFGGNVVLRSWFPWSCFGKLFSPFRSQVKTKGL